MVTVSCIVCVLQTYGCGESVAATWCSIFYNSSPCCVGKSVPMGSPAKLSSVPFSSSGTLNFAPITSLTITYWWSTLICEDGYDATPASSYNDMTCCNSSKAASVFYGGSAYYCEAHAAGSRSTPPGSVDCMCSTTSSHCPRNYVFRILDVACFSTGSNVVLTMGVSKI